ncbi:unnamed protein product [Caenorhabditis sp. 36 PRJEB53466]|nr:unnamed protein product [Caenorhabditis sp. 36 PRJEB53466]
MMTGYGYNSNLVQPLQGVDQTWSQQPDQSQYFTGSGVADLSNPYNYGSMGGWYQAPCYNSVPPPPGLTLHPDQQQPNLTAPQQLQMLFPTLAPPQSSQPRVSISDEELYQALNMSPLPTTSTNVGYHHSHLQQQQQLQHQHLQQHPTDYLSSEACYPSTSSYDSSVYHDQSCYMPAPSTAPPEDPHHYQHAHDGDDEESYGEPERYETMSPTFSIHSFAPTTSTNTAEAEDLEVELINHAKAAPRYQKPDDIDIFLHTGSTDDTEYNEDEDSRPTTTYSHRSTKAPSPPASRPAYAQKLTAAAHQHQQKPEQQCVIADASKTAPLFLQTTAPEPAGFTPLLTPNSDALLQKKLSEVVNNPPQRLHGHAAFPVYPQQPQATRFIDQHQYQESFVDYNPISQVPLSDDYYPSSPLNPRYDYATQVDHDILPLLLDSFKPLPAPQFPTVPIAVPISVPERLTSTTKLPAQATLAPPAAPVKAPRLSDQELDSQSQKLAIDVISNLFTSKKEIIDRAAVINAPKKPVARNLFCNDPISLQKAKSDEPIKMNVIDDWETADDDDLTERMENLMKDIKKEKKKLVSAAIAAQPAVVPTTSKTSDWDTSFLQHVLEIFGVPDYKMQEDVVKAMETIGFGDCKVMWMERKVVFAVFESVARAKNCLTLARHDWLRFRSLADSPKPVQDFAKTSANSLSMPKKKQQTTATVARRMVENALGKKATVSNEKRQEERNQLAAARAAKKNTVQWD